MTPITPPNSTHWLNHLIELRRRILRALIWWLMISSLCLYENNWIYQKFLQPLMHYLPTSSFLIATSLSSTVVTPLKLSFILGSLIAMPFILYELWKFIVPALYPSERKNFAIFLCMSIGLFYLGILFGHFVVLPWLFEFFVMFLPQGIQLMPEIQDHLSFSLRTLFNFGLCFQIPIIMGLLLRAGILSYEQLKSGRRYFIVLAFIIGMLLTPPDVLSQTLLAVPMCLLYELGLWWARYYGRAQV